VEEDVFLQISIAGYCSRHEYCEPQLYKQSRNSVTHYNTRDKTVVQTHERRWRPTGPFI